MNISLASWLQSSQDPSVIANKVKGAILMFSSLIILGAMIFFKVNLTADNIATFASSAGVVAGAIWTIYGCILHFVTWLGTIKKNI